MIEEQRITPEKGKKYRWKYGESSKQRVDAEPGLQDTGNHARSHAGQEAGAGGQQGMQPALDQQHAGDGRAQGQ